MELLLAHGADVTIKNNVSNSDSNDMIRLIVGDYPCCYDDVDVVYVVYY